MRKITVLLTGDDGYNSIGTRLLVYFLKHDCDLSISGTKVQQSGVGGMKSIRYKKQWGQETVDGIPALWVDGTPIDAVECARAHFRKKFDLVISGINLGVNIGGCLISSGTFAAAFYAVNLGLTDVAIAISWDVPRNMYFKNHGSGDRIGSYVSYPGKIAADIIQKSIKERFWGSSLLNINLPKYPTTRARFTKPVLTSSVWPEATVDRTSGMFSYKYGNYRTDIKGAGSDVRAIVKGNISISLCQRTMGDMPAYRKLKEKTFTL